MGDILALLQRLKFRAELAKRCKAKNPKFTADEVLELIETLETKEEQRVNWFQMAQKLGEDLDAAEKRNAELEARTVTANVPDGYVLAPEKANLAMIRAGGKAAREYMEECGGNSPQVIYQAMLAAADGTGVNRITELTGKPAEEYQDDRDLQAAMIFLRETQADYQMEHWLKELRSRRAAGIGVKGE